MATIFYKKPANDNVLYYYSSYHRKHFVIISPFQQFYTKYKFNPHSSFQWQPREMNLFESFNSKSYFDKNQR